jgi:hypothetical protein
MKKPFKSPKQKVTINQTTPLKSQEEKLLTMWEIIQSTRRLKISLRFYKFSHRFHVYLFKFEKKIEIENCFFEGSTRKTRGK